MDKIALYCRTAFADENKIEAQKKRLIDFIKNNDYIVYSDNGESGNILNCPAMNRLSADIRDGLVKTVVTVDASRISRNYINLIKWHDFMDEYDIRIIYLS